MKRFLFLFFLVIIVCHPAWAFKSSEQPVVELKVKGPIIPIVAGYIERGIREAEEKDAICLILLDTPGGLDKSMREIISRIMSSTVPVVVYVYPDGSRAASAGVYILYSAHVAAMAPSTNIGSAHPVSIGVGGGGDNKEDKIMTEKVTNDAVAYIKALARKSGRNEKWAEEAVRKSVSITSAEAFELGVIDIVAKDPNELIIALKGRKVQVHKEEIELRPSQEAPKNIDMTWAEKFLLIISDPSIALILMMLGMSGIAYEFMAPGAILPGVVGGICFILGLYSLGSLPINYAGLFLIIFSVILFIADIKAPTHGVLTAGGVISLLLGIILLIPSDYPYFAISKVVIVVVTTVTSGFFIFIVAMIAKSMKRKSITGEEGMIGRTGTVTSEISPAGEVRIMGELWKARTEGEPISSGERIIVTEIKGLLLIVKKDNSER